MITYIDEQRGSYGVEPICRTLQVAPSTYYAAKTRPPSARAVRDAALSSEITRIHAEHFSVYGSARPGASCAARAPTSAATRSAG